MQDDSLAKAVHFYGPETIFKDYKLSRSLLESEQEPKINCFKGETSARTIARIVFGAEQREGCVNAIQQWLRLYSDHQLS